MSAAAWQPQYTYTHAAESGRSIKITMPTTHEARRFVRFRFSFGNANSNVRFRSSLLHLTFACSFVMIQKHAWRQKNKTLCCIAYQKQGEISTEVEYSSTSPPSALTSYTHSISRMSPCA
jgi:hypothetical protein